MNESDVDLPDEVIDERVFIQALEMNDIFLLKDRYFKNLIPHWGSATITVRGCGVRDASVSQADEGVHQPGYFCVSYKMPLDNFDCQDPKWISLQLFRLFKLSYFCLQSDFILDH